MTELTKFEKLAELKLQIKKLDAEAKELAAELLAEEDCPKKVKTARGILTRIEKNNWACGLEDKIQIFDILGKETFLASCSLTPGGVKKQAGELQLNSLVTDGLFTVKSVSRYFQFKEGK